MSVVARCSFAGGEITRTGDSRSAASWPILTDHVDVIDSYIRASRQQCGPAKMASYYSAIFAEALALCQIPDGTLEIRTTYSVERRVELVRLRRGTYVVYDQHLGQCLSYFNRAMAYAEGPGVGLGYGFKLVGQKARSWRCDRLAVLAAAAHLEMRAQYPLPALDVEAPSAQRSRLLRTHLQERYALMHELGHFKCATDPAFVAHFVPLIEQAIADYVDDRVVNGSVEQTAEQRAAWIARYGEPPDDLARSLALVNQRQRQLLALGGDALREEFICDFFATHQTFASEVARGRDVEEVAVSIVLAFKYLRLLYFVDIAAAYAATKLDGREFRAHSLPWEAQLDLGSRRGEASAEQLHDRQTSVATLVAQLRENVARRHVMLLVQIAAPERADSVQDSVRNAVDRFDEILELPIWQLIPERIEAVAAEGPPFEDTEPMPPMDVIDRALGLRFG